MNIFKKITAISVCLILAAGFTGCEEKSVNGSDNATEATTEEGVTSSPSSADGSVLYESERMKITFVNETKDEYNRYINFSVENFTDEQLMLAANDISIEGRMLDPFLYSVCPANETTETAMEFKLYELERAGITELTELSFSFFITDGSSPEGLESSDILNLKLRAGASPADIEGELLFSNESMNVRFVNAYPSEAAAGYACIYVENLTEQDVFADIKDVFIDGTSVAAEMYDPINAGMDKVCYMDFRDEGVLTEESKTITFNLGLIHPETYEAVAETGDVTASVTFEE